MRIGGFAAVAALFLAIAACASHSGVVPTGQGGYMISKQAATGFPGLGNMKAEALQEAGAYCSGQGRGLVVTNASETQPPYAVGNYPRVEVHFRCEGSARS